MLSAIPIGQRISNFKKFEFAVHHLKQNPVSIPTKILSDYNSSDYNSSD